MKNKKRLFSVILACALCVTLVCAALAEGKLLTIWNAGSKLLFETDNVSLTGHATFTYDGEVFKIFDGRYIQDGVNSYMQVVLDTPQEDGSIYTGSYTVYAEDGTVYSIESARPKLYNTNTTLAEPSILTNTTMRASLMRFGGLLLDLMEDRMGSAVTQEANDAGTQYRINLKAGETPEIANAALTLLTHLAGKEYLYIDPDMMFYSDIDDYTFVENWDQLFAAEYEKNFHEPLPVDFYNQLWDQNGKATVMQARNDMICEIIDLMVMQAEEAYEKGTTVVLADGTFKHYDSYDEYLIATGNEELRYENYGRAFRAYYEQKTGTPLSADDLRTIYMSSNADLSDRYIEMIIEMENEHLSQIRAGGYSCGMVKADGTLVGFNDLGTLQDLFMYTDMTVTRRIFYTLTDITVDTVDLTVDMDKDGRISTVTGCASFIITDKFDVKHTLTVDMNGVAFDYGASRTEAFDPEKLGVISARDYYNGVYSVNDIDDPVKENTFTPPEVIVFDGVEYKVDTGDING